MNGIDYFLAWGFCIVSLFLGITSLTGWSRKFKFLDSLTKAPPDFKRGFGIVTLVMGMLAFLFAASAPTPSTRNENWRKLYQSSVDSVQTVQVSLNEPLNHQNADIYISQPVKLKELLECLEKSKKAWPNHPNPIKQYYMRINFADASAIQFRVKITDNNGTLVYSDHLPTTRNDALGTLVDQLYLDHKAKENNQGDSAEANE